MKFVKKITVFILVAAMLSSMNICFAAETEKDYPEYGTYVLLGDSVASGYNDITENETEFQRIDYSYSAIVADAIGAEFIPMACPGFRTIEMRYMLEDDFEADGYLFHSAIDAEKMEARIPEFRKAISEADLITLGIGGNDFGTFLMWVVTDIMEKEGLCTRFVNSAKKLLEENGTETDILNSFIELADITDALPELLLVLPAAIVYGIVNYAHNWDLMIEDIYKLNPDVTLLVIGMFDNSVKTAEDAKKNEESLFNFSIGQAIINLANTPMKVGADKYGYTFVDTTGTTCDTYHPNAEGHKHIAERILEALPNAKKGTGNIEDMTSKSGLLYSIMFYTKEILSGRTQFVWQPLNDWF